MAQFPLRFVVPSLACALLPIVALVAWSLATGSSQAQSGSMHTCPPAGKWAISVWEGTGGTAASDALALCGPDAVDAAYSLDEQTGAWWRWFAGKPEVSNLPPLDDMQGVLALGSAAAASDQLLTAAQASNQLQHCPPPGKWSIAVWDGAGGTAPADALETCGSGAVTAAYSLDTQTGAWSRWFAGKPEVSNLPPLDNMQGVIALGSGGGSSLSIDKFGEGTVASSPGGINCGAGCTNQAATFALATSVVLTATADPASTFYHWSGCDSVSGNSCTVDMGGDKNVFAAFAFTEAKIPETTKALDAATMSYFLRQEGSTYYFGPQAAAVADLAVGDVMVSGLGEGFLRRVTAINASDQEIAVDTTDAALEDAIERGTIILHKTLTPADLQSSQLASSQQPEPVLTASSSPFSSQFNVGLEAGVGLRGTLSFEPTLDFAVSFDGLKPVEARSILTFQQSTELALFAEAAFTIGEESKIWPPPGSPPLFPPITVPILGIPVVFVPALEVSVGVEGSSVASIETGVTVDATTVTGVHYTAEGGWDAIGEYSENFTYNPPTLSASADFKTFVSPELSVRVYGVVGPYVNLEGYGKLSADPPWWGIYGGLSSSAGFSVDFPIVGRVLDFHATPLQQEWQIAEGEIQSPTPTPTATSTPTPTSVPTPEPTETPTPSPGLSGRIAFASDGDGDFDIYVMNADGTGQTRLTNNSADDHHPAWSPDGSKIAFSINHEIYVMNADGSQQTNLTNSPAWDADPAWSPDGSKIAFESNRDGNEEIYVIDADGTDQIRLTNNSSIDWAPAWSPDGSTIAFSTTRDGNDVIYAMNADGTGQTRVGGCDNPAWSPDGSKIAFDCAGVIYIMNADGTGWTRLTNNSPAWDNEPAWSPDGSKIAYYSNRDGENEIYVMNSDGTDQINVTNNPANDVSPAWSP